MAWPQDQRYLAHGPNPGQNNALPESYDAPVVRQLGWQRWKPKVGPIDSLMRPVLALGTVRLFVFTVVDPVAFSTRMVGLDAISRELWWLLGAIVSFCFGARELHYSRKSRPAKQSEPSSLFKPTPIAFGSNAAVLNWMRARTEV